MFRSYRASSDGGAVGALWNGWLCVVAVAVLALGAFFGPAYLAGDLAAETTTPAGPVVPDTNERSPLHQLYLDSRAEADAQPGR